MDNVSKTLYIPLYGKALVSRRGLLLRDPWAERIWEQAGIPLSGKAASKWLAYHIAMRARVFDRWLEEQTCRWPDAVVLHLGCGLDSRCRRVEAGNQWFDVDFPEVIRVRREHFEENGHYRMLGADLREDWLRDIPGGRAIVVMEGISMYLTAPERQALLRALAGHFTQVQLLMDSYTVFGARATRYKNPINQVGVTEVSGFDDPEKEAEGTGFSLLREHCMTPPELIAQLPRREQGIFRTLFAGGFAHRIYRMYEYRT